MSKTFVRFLKHCSQYNNRVQSFEVSCRSDGVGSKVAYCSREHRNEFLDGDLQLSTYWITDGFVALPP